MATCSRCGNANVTGKFCGTCGAPVSQQAAGAMPTPPPPAPQQAAGAMPTPPPAPQQGWQQPTQAPPPVPNQPQQVWQPTQAPPPVPNQPPQGWQQPNQGPAPVPPKKGGAGKVIGIIAGVVVLLIVGLFVVVALLPDDPAVDPVKPAPMADKGNTPVTPAPANQPANTNPNQQPAAAKAYPSKMLAQGTFDFTNFTAYDGFGGFQVTLARNNGDKVEMAVYEFVDGQFRKAVEAFFQHGQLQDVNHGEIFNDGQDLSIVSATNGITLIDEVGNTQPLDGRTARHMLVGDYDADGNVETMTVLQQNDGYTFDIQRYKAGSQAEKLKSMANFKFLGSPQVVKLAGDNRALVLGMAAEQAAGGLGLQALHVNIDSGTFDQYGLWTVPEGNDAVVVGYTATTINGKDTLLVSYAGAQPRVELFDISKKGAYAPASLGTIKLLEGAGRGLILGKFTQNKNPEIFTFTMDGQFAIYGF